MHVIRISQSAVVTTEMYVLLPSSLLSLLDEGSRSFRHIGTHLILYIILYSKDNIDISVEVYNHPPSSSVGSHV
jgi:hypothetical protein